MDNTPQNPEELAILLRDSFKEAMRRHHEATLYFVRNEKPIPESLRDTYYKEQAEIIMNEFNFSMKKSEGWALLNTIAPSRVSVDATSNQPKWIKPSIVDPDAPRMQGYPGKSDGE